MPLTWPLDRSELQMNANYHRHVPYLQLKQISYKRDVLEHPTAGILHTAVRVAIPAIGVPMRERTQRDEGIIKLVLYFLRNMVIIDAPSDLTVEWNENEVSRSATIEAFEKQDVLALLLTMASNTGEEFTSQDVLILEILFHLIKGVEVEKVFMKEEELSAQSSKDLRGLMGKEADMLRSYSKSAPTRHNRFGTMIWVKRDEERVSAVSGQNILADSTNTLTKMDQSKRWNKPQQRKKQEHSVNHFDLPVPLTRKARKRLQAFVTEFLDSGFNPLFSHLRRAIEHEADRVLDAHKQQFFYVISWFLQAERIRQGLRHSKQEGNQEAAQTVTGNFGIVASVLNQETFVVINRFMDDYLQQKQWHQLNASMRCFTQILLTVQEMTESKQDIDQEIADNIQNRIFYEETTHDRILSILRGYNKQGFSYLDAATELSHVFLRMLERYSKENLDLQIRSKRRSKKKQKPSQPDEGQRDHDDLDSEAEELAEAKRVSKERKFDFNRFASKFVTQNCVDSFVKFTAYFKDLNSEQLKRAHRFFHRVAFKQEMSVTLFRLDILELFHRMVKGTGHLPTASPYFAEWEEFVKQLFRRLTKKLEQRPELFVELLFSKIQATTFFLEHGHEKQTISAKPRAPTELEVRGALARDERLGVAVAVLHEKKMEAINFVRASLEAAAAARQSWQDEAVARALQDSTEGAERASPNGNGVSDIGEHLQSLPVVSADPPLVVKAPGEGLRMDMFKDNKLRLLMSLAGLVWNGKHDNPDGTWVIPASLTAEALRDTAATIEKHRLDPVHQYGDDEPVAAEEMLQKKSKPVTRRAAFDDDSGIESDDFGEEDFLFPAGGPTASKSAALEELKSKRRKRKRQSQEDVDEETAAARRKVRKLTELEKQRKIKSELYVHDSDDEEDEARDLKFFRSERELQRKHAAKVVQSMQSHAAQALSQKRKQNKVGENSCKKPRSGESELSDDLSQDSTNDALDSGIETRGDAASSPSTRGLLGLDLGTSDLEESDTPMSSPSDEAEAKVAGLSKHSDRAGASSTRVPQVIVDDDIPDVHGVEPLDSSDSVMLERPQSDLSITGKDLMRDEEAGEDDDVLAHRRRGCRRQRIAVLDDSDDE